MTRGGHNKKQFGPFVRAHYSLKNVEDFDARGIHDCKQVLWKCLHCGCYLFKARHAVACSLSKARSKWDEQLLRTGFDEEEQEALLGMWCGVFHCPFHDGGASSYAGIAHAILCRQAAMLMARHGVSSTVVWEAHVVHGQRAYDLMLFEQKVLVEVDGEHHTGEAYCWDVAKSVGAVHEGWHVVRLHYSCMWQWQQVIAAAVSQALARQPATVHFTAGYFELQQVS